MAGTAQPEQFLVDGIRHGGGQLCAGDALEKDERAHCAQVLDDEEWAGQDVGLDEEFLELQGYAQDDQPALRAVLR